MINENEISVTITGRKSGRSGNIQATFRIEGGGYTTIRELKTYSHVRYKQGNNITTDFFNMTVEKLNENTSRMLEGIARRQDADS